MTSLFAVLDFGTSSVKAAIVGLDGRMHDYSRIAAPIQNPAPGRSEIPSTQILDISLDIIQEALVRSGSRPEDVAGICITGQRASFLCIDETGAPLGNAISWQDSRGTEEACLLQAGMDQSDFRSLTGLPCNPVFTVAKLMWMFRHDGERSKHIRHVVTIPDYLLYELGAGEVVSDHANASLTGMFDITHRMWSDTVLSAAGIPASIMPRPVPSGTKVGTLSRSAAERTGLLPGTPLFAGAGDHQCAGIGAGALESGIVELALGTSAVPLMTLEQLPATRAPGLMYCCHGIPGQWEVEGFQNSAGSALAWGSRLFGHASHVGAPGEAHALPGSHGILFFPYLCGGSSAPHWNPAASGVFLGLSLRHTPADLEAAILEGILLESSNILHQFPPAGFPLREIRLTGGCSQHPRIPRILAGITRLPIRVPCHSESGLMGAAMIAAVGSGAFPSLAAAAASMVQLGPPETASEAEQEACSALLARYRAAANAFETGRIFLL